MLEASYVLIATKSRAERVRGDFMPWLRDVRRVPVRYQRALPLPMVKYHQCVVLGATSHTLTVGVIEHKGEQWLTLVQALTGTTIFPVLVAPERMRLLISRVERYQRFRQRYSRAYYVLQLPFQMRQFLLLRERAGA
jgi:hypothetical protein